MIALTLGPGETALWWIALAVGAVVIGVVVALLALLSRLLHDVSASASSLATTAERIGAEGGAGLGEAASVLRELHAEIRLHEHLLSR